MIIDLLVRAVCRKPVKTDELVPDDVALRSAGWLTTLAGALSGMNGPAAAVTLGRTIVLHPSVRITGELVRHELEHVRQWQQHRYTFPVRYVLNHFRYGYDRNPYEVAARAAENRRSV